MSQLQPDYFTADSEVQSLVNQLQQLRNKRVSDIVDEEGHQYIDLVMEGGGVLGLSLVGYTYGLEAAGIRFRSVAGTSAGAINALLVQALGTPFDAKSEKMIAAVANMPMASFQDGNKLSRLATEAWLAGKHWLWKYSVSLAILRSLLKHLGLNPGTTFHQWLKDILAENHSDSWRALKQQMNTPVPGLRFDPVPLPDNIEVPNAPSFDPQNWQVELKVVTAELSSTTKIVLPERDGKLFYTDLNQANPADFARASMSVPVFFYPFKVPVPKTQSVTDAWQALGYKKKSMPDTAVFVDGGLISNFPINLFHTTNSVPKMPTFGAKLGIEEYVAGNIDGIKPYLGSLIGAMRHDADKEFIRKNPDYKKLVKSIDTGEHHWLDFELANEAKLDLFKRGLAASLEFLDNFDWPEYKKTRLTLAGLK